jgi:uncharacterized membrane protein YbhN (UPF0104 family)
MLAKAIVSIGLLALLFSRVDGAALWASFRTASPAWLATALGLYTMHVLASIWRWHVLLVAQQVDVKRRTLLSSFLVATFFNNFLPSNIGGDVIRIHDTARPARSKTLATTVVLVDRVLGLIGLVLVAAVGATAAASLGRTAGPIWPSWLWAGFLIGTGVAVPAVFAPWRVGQLLRPLARLHPEWIGARIDTLTATLDRFRAQPAAIVECFVGAVVVQALLVAYYLAVVLALNLSVSVWDLAVLVPVSFVVQMLPVSVNGFGVREATFSLYFRGIGLPVQSALLLSLVATALGMLFSLSGAAVYLSRRRQA